jgi:hypothetical protein
MWRRLVCVCVGLATTACAATTTGSTRQVFRNAGRDVITAAEIVASRVSDVYQAVAQLRPEFLRRQNQATLMTPATVAVYLDDLPFGTVESLRSIPLDQVRLIQYMRSTEANFRWGGSHPAGAILVTTLKK